MRHMTPFSPFTMVVTETNLERHDYRSTWMRAASLVMVLSKGTSVDQLT